MYANVWAFGGRDLLKLYWSLLKEELYTKGKYPNVKRENIWNIVYCSANHILKFREDLMFFLLTIDPSLNNNQERLLSTTTLILFAYWYKCTIFGFNWQTYTEVWQLTWYFQFILSVVSSCQQVWLICHVHLLQLLNFNCTHRCHWRTRCLSFLSVQLKMHHRISP